MSKVTKAHKKLAELAYETLIQRITWHKDDLLYDIQQALAKKYPNLILVKIKVKQ